MSEKIEQTENFEFGGIFAVTAENFEQPTSSNFNEDFLALKLDDEKVKDGRYVVTGRLVPDVNCGEIRRDRVTKHMYYLPDPNDPKARIYVDAPSNNPKLKDLATAAYMKHVYDKGKNYDQNTPIQLSKRLEVLKRNTYNYSLFLIYDDPQHPELNGKIKILRYGKILNVKLDQLLKGDPILKRKPIVPFDLINGKDLTIVVSEGNQNMPTYEQSSFNDGLCGISFDCGKTTIKEFNQETGKQVFDFLKTNSPDLSQTYYKETTAEDAKLLINCIKIAFGEQYYKEFCELYFEVFGTQYVPEYNNVTTVAEGQQAVGLQQGTTQVQPKVAEQPKVVETTTQPKVVETTTDKASVDTTSKFKSLKDNAGTVSASEKPVETVIEANPVETIAANEKPVETAVKSVTQTDQKGFGDLNFDNLPDDIN